MTNEELHEYFQYDEVVGSLRKIKNAKTPFPWRPTGRDGRYRATTFRGRTYYLHRLVWQYFHGEVPAMVDHKDRDTTSNRIENLRPCTPAQNQYNSAMKRSNRSGAKGVVEHKNCSHKKYQAKIVVEGRVRSLGYYPTVAEAANAYDEAARDLAGTFARLNAA